MFYFDRDPGAPSIMSASMATCAACYRGSLQKEFASAKNSLLPYLPPIWKFSIHAVRMVYGT